MNSVFFSTGSNLGYRKVHLKQAEILINENVGKVVKKSSLYSTAPWGHVDQPVFLNQVLEAITILNAAEVLKVILAIEKKMGRIRHEKMGARIIDIDLLFFNAEIINTKDLTVPHPFLHLRNFVLQPLQEIAPFKIHPLLRKNINDLAQESDDRLLATRLTNDKD